MHLMEEECMVAEEWRREEGGKEGDRGGDMGSIRSRREAKQWHK